MKIQVISDTHNSKYTLNNDADIIVHAGDFSNSLVGAQMFVNACKEKGKEFIFVLGNHDYYNGNISYIDEYLSTHFSENCLTATNVIEKKGYTFVGGTLFTNFRSNKQTKKEVTQYQTDALDYISDFRVTYIGRAKPRLVVPEDYVKIFNQTLKNINKYKNKKKVVVVTHFPPHVSCLDPYWGTHPTASCLNPYFINDISVKGFSTWICGHTHTAVDTIIDGCRIVINPLGYSTEKGVNGFEENKIIEV